MAFVSFLLIVTISPFVDFDIYTFNMKQKKTTNPAYSEEHAGLDGESRTPISLTPMHGPVSYTHLTLPTILLV